MPAAATYTFAATCPKGVEALLARELREMGIAGVTERSAVVTFTGPLGMGYRACLWSRLASRVLLQLTEFPASTAEALYDGTIAVAWEEHISPDGTIAVDAVGSTKGLTHSGFAARKVKDAVVDRLRERFDRRPSVDLTAPDVRLNLRLHKERATLSLDLAGAPLHERGYRTPGEQVAAPLKENLAAAVLVRAGWPEVAAAGGALMDPMCGSGTLLIEGALMAGDRAPGLLRSTWGFEHWLGHDAEAWDDLLAEADDRAEAGLERLPLIAGSDSDASAIELARACAKRAGLAGLITLEVADVASLTRPADAAKGLLVTNPPYGVRLGERATLGDLYATLGRRLAAAFEGWRAAVLTPDAELARATGLRSSARHRLYNGAIETGLFVFEITPGSVRAEVRRTPDAPSGAGAGDGDGGSPRAVGTTAMPRSAGAEMVANRLRKNLKHLSKWARREGVTCFRVYDADLPEYAAAVDLYEEAGCGRRFAHVQEYAAPASVDPDKAALRLDEIVEVIPEVLGVAPGDVVVKVRRRQRGDAQYERQAATGEFIEVAEGGLRFLVNLRDYLDTGIFLDHRPVRALVRDLASGRRVCNLFAYTGSVSVYAAAGGATETVTVDMSSTYLGWAKRQMALNGFPESRRHRFERADVLAWLGAEGERIAAGTREPYGLVFVDPPTFSTSKKMGERTFDVQRDHVALLRASAALLADDGELVFSNNNRRFVLDADALPELDIEDVTAATIPPDFARTPRIHACFRIRLTKENAPE
jgi:23S rRNA (guanine2445-N2)-methyltransferase / 23S rRNA (guanine2069-N7)-methyltransferase